MVKVCQTLVQTRSNERVRDARALSHPPSRADVSRRELRLCRVKAVKTIAMAGSRQSRADISDAS